MKAILKINYKDMKKGETYNFRIVSDKIVTCNGVDFGWSEIKVDNTDCKTMRELGEYINIHGDTQFGQLGLKTNKDKACICKSVLPNVPQKTKEIALDKYLFDGWY